MLNQEDIPWEEEQWFLYPPAKRKSGGVSLGVLSVMVWCGCAARLMQCVGVETSRTDGIQRKTGKAFLEQRT